MSFISSLLKLDPGLYILRHPHNGVVLPLSVTRAPGTMTGGRMEVLGTPGTEGTILRSGADCIVVQITEAPVDLLVTACVERKNGAMPALRVDQVALDTNLQRTDPGISGGRVPITIPDAGISVIAHVERKGDLIATDGALLGEPASNLRIGGLQVMWPDRPAGVDLQYQVTVEGAPPSPSVTTGRFCGTRGQSGRIVQAGFSLAGPNASNYRLRGTAYFSGGFQVPLDSGAPLSGPSGMEHLTGLSLNVVAESKPVPARSAPGANATRKTPARSAKAATQHFAELNQ